MKVALIAVLFAATAAFAGDAAWKEHNGRFATFQAPPAMTRDTNSIGVDSIWDGYDSPDISLSFDSEAATLPATLQKDLQRTVAAWAAQRGDAWSKSNYVEGGGAIHGYEDDKRPKEMPYYLYLGLAAGENSTFAIHVRFRSLDLLEDIERILKSIKLKTR